MASDFEMLDRWGAGDRAAGNELFAAHFESVLRFFRNKVRDGVEDLVQQTFLACVESREQFRQESNFRTFLFSVARNVLFNEFRRRRRKDAPIDFGSISAADVITSPTSVMARKAEQKLLLQGLRAIPLDYQVALELYLWEGLSGSELAGILGLSEPGVRSRLRRAKEALKKKLEEFADSPELLVSTTSDLESWAASLRELAGKQDDGE